MESAFKHGWRPHLLHLLVRLIAFLPISAVSDARDGSKRYSLPNEQNPLFWHGPTRTIRIKGKYASFFENFQNILSCFSQKIKFDQSPYTSVERRYFLRKFVISRACTYGKWGTLPNCVDKERLQTLLPSSAESFGVYPKGLPYK